MKNIPEGLEFLYKLIETIPQGILVFDIEGKVTLLNERALSTFGIKGATTEYLEQPVFNIIAGTKLESRINKTLKNGRKDFNLKAIPVNDYYLDFFGRKITNGMLLFISNVTGIIHSNQKAMENFIKGQEIERKRLAREIHDGIGPDISSIKLAIDSLSNKIEQESLLERISNISNEVSLIAQNIRGISHDLMPSSILDFGLVSALSNLSNKFEEYSEIKIINSIEITDADPQLSTTQALNIYRIFQECIQNGIKHGRAKEFEVSVFLQDDCLVMKICNDGSLRDVDSKNGLGVNNMKSRVNSMLGQFKIGENSNNKFEVGIEIPVN